MDEDPPRPWWRSSLVRSSARRLRKYVHSSAHCASETRCNTALPNSARRQPSRTGETARQVQPGSLLRSPVQCLWAHLARQTCSARTEFQAQPMLSPTSAYENDEPVCEGDSCMHLAQKGKEQPLSRNLWRKV